MKKKYLVDTNVLIENENALEILRNGEENEVFITETILDELDGLKKDKRIGFRAMKVIDNVLRNREWVNVLPDTGADAEKPDDRILATARGIEDVVLVTNDKVLQIKCFTAGVLHESFKKSIPFEGDSEVFTGISHYDETREPGEYLVRNSFYWREGKLFFWDGASARAIDHENSIWKVVPKDQYQNAAMELLLDRSISLLTIQSEAGKGKTFLALAAALYWVLEKKAYDKIYIFKPNIEIGSSLGFLPGEVGDKLAPYFQSIKELIKKLHGLRPAKVFSNPDRLEIDPMKVEMLPINFIRGMNIDNAFVIVDEMQNLSRLEARTLLSRMGENVKCVCVGDTKQVDNPYLNEDNNALNWAVRLFKGNRIYSHMVLKGAQTRGPICDLVLRSKL
jgi:PhoH-like ATPase